MAGRPAGANRAIIVTLIIGAIVVLGALAGPALFGGKGYAGLILAAVLVFAILPVVIVIAVRKLPGAPKD